MRKWISVLPLPALGILLPTLASAQLDTLTDTVSNVGDFFNLVIGLFVALAVIVFFWGLIKYLWGANAENASEGLKLMFWGIIAIFVMVSIWGIIALLRTSFGVDTNESIRPAEIPFP